MGVNLLWEKFQKGDSIAFETLYSSHIDGMIAYGSRFTRDKTLVEDCIHDLFVRIYERRQNLKSPDSLKAYLWSSLRREILQSLKKQEPTRDHLSESEFSMDIDFEQALINSEFKQEQLVEIQRVLSELSDRQREVVFLSFYNGLDHDEIAQILDINNQSVRNLLSQGLKRMRSSSQIPTILLITSLSKLF